jgi:anti-sigma factor RsiW
MTRKAKVMKCADLLRMLNDYVDGDIDPGICKEFEKHLAGCNPCTIVVDNVRKTITLYREKSVFELPALFQARLHAALREKGRSKHARKPKR